MLDASSSLPYTITSNPLNTTTLAPREAEPAVEQALPYSPLPPTDSFTPTTEASLPSATLPLPTEAASPFYGSSSKIALGLGALGAVGLIGLGIHHREALAQTAKTLWNKLQHQEVPSLASTLEETASTKASQHVSESHSVPRTTNTSNTSTVIDIPESPKPKPPVQTPPVNPTRNTASSTPWLQTLLIGITAPLWIPLAAVVGMVGGTAYGAKKVLWDLLAGWFEHLRGASSHSSTRRTPVRPTATPLRSPVTSPPPQIPLPPPPQIPQPPAPPQPIPYGQFSIPSISLPKVAQTPSTLRKTLQQHDLFNNATAYREIPHGTAPWRLTHCVKDHTISRANPNPDSTKFSSLVVGINNSYHEGSSSSLSSAIAEWDADDISNRYLQENLQAHIHLYDEGHYHKQLNTSHTEPPSLCWSDVKSGIQLSQMSDDTLAVTFIAGRFPEDDIVPKRENGCKITLFSNKGEDLSNAQKRAIIAYCLSPTNTFIVARDAAGSLRRDKAIQTSPLTPLLTIDEKGFNLTDSDDTAARRNIELMLAHWYDAVTDSNFLTTLFKESVDDEPLKARLNFLRMMDEHFNVLAVEAPPRNNSTTP